MKLILAIVNNDDSTVASAALTDAGFFVTRLSTTGGFLMVGNTTLLIGTEDSEAPVAVEILKKHCTTRKHVNSHPIYRKKDMIPLLYNTAKTTTKLLFLILKELNHPTP